MSVSRRTLMQSVAMAAAASSLPSHALAEAERRPNIVWIVCHDIHARLLGCYGNALARTPTIDAMAQRGIRYDHAYSTAPVCAPSRFALVTGMYAQSCGPAHDMRALGSLPPGARPLPVHLRAAGYYCTNNAFTDYNLVGDQAALWDESDNKAHWRNRPAGKPFFCVYNYTITHESHIFGHAPTTTDPAAVTVPPFLPDLPAIRTVLARNTDMVNRQDAAVAHLLAELDEDGLADDTFVFFTADHGGVHPRSKRYLYDDGLHIPLIVQVPKHFAALSSDPPGRPSERVVSTIDMAPTVLALAGVPIPANMPGTPFLGAASKPPRQYAFSMRDRMDERYDLSYTLCDERYRYTRNYSAQRPYAQHGSYEWQSDAYQAWEQAHLDGTLNEVQSRFWQAKPVEELYDREADPHSIHNLMEAAEHRARSAAMGKALDAFMLAQVDNGFLAEGLSPQGYEASRAPGAYPLREVLTVAALGLQQNPANTAHFTAGLTSKDECLRYWHAQGLCLLPTLPSRAVTALQQRLAAETSAPVRCVLAETLIHAGRTDIAMPALLAIVQNDSAVRNQLRALGVLSAVAPATLEPHRAVIAAAVEVRDEYVPEVAKWILLHIDGTYRPDSNTMGSIGLGAASPAGGRAAANDPQI